MKTLVFFLLVRENNSLFINKEISEYDIIIDRLEKKEQYKILYEMLY